MSLYGNKILYVSVSASVSVSVSVTLCPIWSVCVFVCHGVKESMCVSVPVSVCFCFCFCVGVCV